MHKIWAAVPDKKRYIQGREIAMMRAIDSNAEPMESIVTDFPKPHNGAAI
jgi:hypothetical protein